MVNTGCTENEHSCIRWFYRRKCISPFQRDLYLRSRSWSPATFIQVRRQAASVMTLSGTALHWMRCWVVWSCWINRYRTWSRALHCCLMMAHVLAGYLLSSACFVCVLLILRSYVDLMQGNTRFQFQNTAGVGFGQISILRSSRGQIWQVITALTN